MIAHICILVENLVIRGVLRLLTLLPQLNDDVTIRNTDDDVIVLMSNQYRDPTGFLSNLENIYCPILILTLLSLLLSSSNGLLPCINKNYGLYIA